MSESTNPIQKQLEEKTSPIDYYASKLMPKQKLFADYYIDPDSPTYGNATASLLKAGYTDNKAKSVMACKLLKKKDDLHQ